MSAAIFFGILFGGLGLATAYLLHQQRAEWRAYTADRDRRLRELKPLPPEWEPNE